jgi:hypothetical protein
MNRELLTGKLRALSVTFVTNFTHEPWVFSSLSLPMVILESSGARLGHSVSSLHGAGIGAAYVVPHPG